MPFPGGKHGSGHYVPVGGFVFTIDNSANQGILMFGGFNFPCKGAQTPGQIIISIFENSVCTDVVTDTYDAGPPATDKYVMNIDASSGALYDFGSAGFASNLLICVASGNSGRWETASGVPRTVQRTMALRIQLNNLGGLPGGSCPGSGGPVFERTYDITAIFTG